jgi:hemerythrin
MTPATFIFCSYPPLNEQFMWLFRQLSHLRREEPGTGAFCRHLSNLACYIREQFVLEENLMRDLDFTGIEDQITEHVQLLGRLRQLLELKAGEPPATGLHEEFRVLLQRHIDAHDHRFVGFINEIFAPEDCDPVTLHDMQDVLTGTEADEKAVAG